jgi:glycosyltransferase involved in cell wall biosynthesis
VRVLFDHQIFSYQRFGGASRYFHELMNVFHRTGAPAFELGVARSPNEYLRGAAYYGGRSGRADRFVRTYARNELATRLAAWRRPPDVLHATFYDPASITAARRAKLVVTVLDMIPERFPEMFPRTGAYARLVTQRWIHGKRALCARAAVILAISESTKRDLVELYGLDPARVTVTHLGNRLAPTPDASPPASLPPRYVLFVGTRNTYKNFALVLEAIRRLDVGLACVGGGPFDSDELSQIARLGLAGRVVQASVTDAELAACYAHALAFVFPSRYEGFGIPILEAFACGCPVLVARASCFPEIAGDAARYFDPDDASELAALLADVIDDRAAADLLRERGRARAAQFTWEATAARTLAAYREVA